MKISKLRKLKYKFNKILTYLKLKIETFSQAKVIILTGTIIGIVSLFLDNIIGKELNIKFSFFNRITGIIAIISFVLFIIILFLLFSYNKKEKIKQTANVLFRDYFLIILFSIVLFLLSIVNISIIYGLKYIFSSDIIYGNGAVFYIISSIIIFIGAILLKNEFIHSQNIVLSETIEDKKVDDSKNTKLPF